MKHTAYSLASLVAFACSTNLCAFEIRGRVVDAATQSGLGKVTVQFLSLDAKVLDTTSTDDSGEFKKEVPDAHKQFRISYAKSSGGPDDLGYEGFGRTFPVDNNVRIKDVDTVALRPRRKQLAKLSGRESDAIVKDWLGYFYVTKDQSGLDRAVQFYAIEPVDVNRSWRAFQMENARPPGFDSSKLLLYREPSGVVQR